MSFFLWVRWSFGLFVSAAATVAVVVFAVFVYVVGGVVAACGHFHPTNAHPIYPEIAQQAFGKFVCFTCSPSRVFFLFGPVY